MSLMAVTFALLSSFFWTCFNATRKTFSQGVSPFPALVLLMAGQLPFFGLWAMGLNDWRIAPPYWLPGLASGLLNCLGNLFFLLSVKSSPLSTTVPLLSFSPLFAGVFGVLFLNEVMRPIQWFAVFLVVSGCILLNAPKGNRWRFLTERGAWYMIFTALMWSSSSLADKAAVQHAATPVHALLQCAQVALFGLVGTLILKRSSELKAPFVDRSLMRVFVLSLLTAVGGLGFQLLAVQQMFVSLFETIKRSLEVFVTLAIGQIYFKEPMTRQKLGSAMVIVAGVILLLSSK